MVHRPRLHPRLRRALAAALVLLGSSCGDKAPAGAPAPPVVKGTPATKVDWNPDSLLGAPGEFIAEPGSGTTFLEGKVVDEDGKPVAGAIVEMHALPKMGSFFLSPLLHCRATAGPDGAFRVGPGPSPWWSQGVLSARAPGFARASLVSRYLTIPGQPCAEEGEPSTLVLHPGFPVKGQVRAKDGGPPDGVVNLWTVGAHGSFEVLPSDAAGAFEFTAPAGTVTVSVLEGAHPAASSRAEVAAGSDNRIAIQVVRGRDIKGKVLDAATGKPVPNAVLRGNYGVTRLFRAGADGEFVLPKYWYGAFQVRSPGYATQVHKLAEDAGTAGVPPESVRLAPGFVARGRVLDLDGKPIPNARLRILSRDPAGDWASSAGPFSATDGSFVFVGLPLPAAGHDVHLFATAPECAWGISESLPGTAGAVFEGVEVRIPRLVDLEGRLEDENGVPLAADMNVSWDIAKELALYTEVFPSTSPARSGEDGNWRLRLPERTPFRIVAKGETFGEARLEGKTPAAGAKATGPGLILKAMRGLSIRGVILDAAGERVRRGEVRVEPHPPTDPRPSRDARIREDGTFEAGGLTAGAYDFSVLVHPEFLQKVIWDVAAGKDPVTVVLKRPGGLKFKVVMGPGVPEGTPPVVSLRALEDTKPLAPDHDLRLDPYNPVASIGPLAPAAYALVVTAGDFRIDVPRIEVKEGTPTDIGEVVLVAGGVVEGTVTLAGVPLPGAAVEAVRILPEGGAESAKRGGTNTEGAFRLGGLKPGSHRLLVRCPDRPLAEFPFESVPEKVATLTAALAAGGRLTVTVKDAAGKPVTGARVLLLSGGAGVPYWKSGAKVPGTHDTGEDGTLRCTGVPAGEFTVRVEKPGVGSGDAPVKVVDGGDGTVDVRLAK